MKHSYKSIDEVLTGRVRLAILSFLMAAGQSDFTELQKATEATKGNLAAHIHVLEGAGYINIERQKKGRRSYMTLTITDKGKTALQSHIEHLQSLMRAMNNGK
jgi:DNA-binding MarR family transcriptional regulator